MKCIAILLRIVVVFLAMKYSCSSCQCLQETLKQSAGNSGTSANSVSSGDKSVIDYILSELSAGKEADLRNWSDGKHMPGNKAHISGMALSALFANSEARNKRIMNRHGVWITNLIVDDDVDLQGTAIPYFVSLKDSDFRGRIILSLAHFSNRIQFTNCIFYNKVDCFGLRCDSNITFEHDRFLDEANFKQCQIAGDLSLIRSEFPDISLYGDSRWDSISMTNIAKELHDHPDGKLAVQLLPLLSGDVKKRITGYNNAYLSAYSEARQDPEVVELRNSLKKALNDLLQKQDPWKPDQIRNLPLDEIEENLAETRLYGADLIFRNRTLLQEAIQEAYPNQFESRVMMLDLQQMQIGGFLILERTIVTRPVYFNTSKIAKSLIAPWATFHLADFSSSETGAWADFSNVHFQSALFMRYAKFPILDFSNIPDLPEKTDIDFDGLSFDRILPARWDAVQKLVSRSEYSSQLYTNLDAAFKRAGQTDSADAAFVEGKWRETCASGVWGHLTGWISYALVGYGRRPWLSFIWSSLVVVFGCIVFRNQGDMDNEALTDPPKIDPTNSALAVPISPSKYNSFRYSLGLFLSAVVIGYLVYRRQNDIDNRALIDAPKIDPTNSTLAVATSSPKYNAFWYSLGLFLPAIKLQTSEEWTPKETYGFGRNYANIHKLLGWILIPFGIAALTGLIK